MTQQQRPGQRPAARPPSVGEAAKPQAPQPTEESAKKPAGDQTQAGPVTTYGAGTQAPQYSQRDQGAGGSPGTLSPRDVWQLAVWAVTPPYDESEAAYRRAEVRTILTALVDQVTGEGQEKPQTAPEPVYGD